MVENQKVEGRDVEFPQSRAEIRRQSLHDSLIPQPQDQIPRVALEAGADHSMFLATAFERFEKPILAFRGFWILLQIKIFLQSLLELQKRLRRITANQTVRRQDDDVFIVHIGKVCRDVIECLATAPMYPLVP